MKIKTTIILKEETVPQLLENIRSWLIKKSPPPLTSAVVVVDGEHVDGDDLQHVRAAQQGRAVLQQRPELLQDAAGHSGEGLHAGWFKQNTRRFRCGVLVLFGTVRAGTQQMPLTPL